MKINLLKINIRKFRFNVLIISLIFLILSPVIFAATSATSSSVSTRPDNIYDSFLNGTTERLVGGILTTSSSSSSGSGLSDLTVGRSNSMIVEDPALSKQLKTNGLNPENYVGMGVLGYMAQLGNYTYEGAAKNGPDAVTYVADKFTNKVSAQSSALQGLSPILILWGTLRNVTYVLIALSMVVTGLVFYFKGKQGKQDNVSLASGITDIVTTLITITFSYVIAGVMIDLIVNVGNVAIASFFSQFINSDTILNNLYTPNSGTNIFSILSDFQNNSSSGSIVNVVQTGLSSLSVPLDKINTFVGQTVPAPVNIFFNALATVIFGIAKGITNSSINSPLITAILAFTIFIIIFRIVFLLLGSFVGIILTIGFAPLILIPGAFPGPSATDVFTNWIKRVLSLAIVFPVVFALILLSAIFLNLGNTSSTLQKDCVYDNTTTSPVQIPGIQNQADIFSTTRFKDNTNNTPLTTDNYANIRKCFPILLPPKFNWLPAPIGNLGAGFDIDDFTRFVVGIALIIIVPNITKAIQDALKLKSTNLATAKDALAGAGIFNTFLSQIPIIGKPLSQITGGITGAIQ